MTTPDPQPTSAQTVSTPAVGSVAKKSLFWVAAFVFVLIVAALSFSTVGSGADAERLAGDSPNPVGAKAVLEVLRDRGVTVHLASSMGEAAQAASDTSTVFLYDEKGLLDDEQLARVGGLGARLVVAAADFDTLQQLAPQVAMAGTITDAPPLTAECAVGFASRVDAITADGQGYRIIDDQAGQVTGCFPSHDDAYLLVEVGGARTTTVIGSTAVFANETIVDAGNAALALTLLGQSDSLVWYLPSLADLPAGEPSLAELSPDWLPAVTGLLALVALAAALWRGRRFGPLVVERLPVVVPASETMEGRARLYQRAAARGHAIDSIRIGTIGRLASVLGLSRLSDTDEVVNAVATRIGVPAREIHHVLVANSPTTDAELVALSDALLTLEQQVAATVAGRRGPTSVGPTSVGTGPTGSDPVEPTTRQSRRTRPTSGTEQGE